MDIRTEAEYLAGHIKGAKWFPRGRLEYYIQELINDSDSKVVLYWRTGGRSALATSVHLNTISVHIEQVMCPPEPKFVSVKNNRIKSDD